MPSTSGVVLWLNAVSLSIAACPCCTWSMSLGVTLASMTRVSARGTTSMIGSPGLTTPPTVWTASWWTTPSWGARMSVRFSWSSAATRFSTSSAIFPCTSPSSFATSLRKFWSTWITWSSVSEIFPFACAMEATSCPYSPSRRAASRSRAVTRWIGTRFLRQSSRTPSSSRLIRSISRFLAATCPVRPWISSRSCPVLSLNCAFCPARASRRSSNSRISPATTLPASGSVRPRSRRAAGNLAWAAPSRSVSRRPCRAVSSMRLLSMAERFALVTVSSRRRTTCPARTTSPSRTRSSPTTPPVGC